MLLFATKDDECHRNRTIVKGGVTYGDNSMAKTN